MPEHYTPPPKNYPAQKARQAEVILTRRWQRIALYVGLASLVVLSVIVGWLGVLWK